MSRLPSVCGLLFLCVTAFAQTSFHDDFDTPALDPAWTVVQYTAPFPRSYGYTSPANSYSLTASPGNLGYTLEPMTHEWGFVTNYTTSLPGEVSCCNHDPGVDLVRTFSGDQWLFETKVHTYMPYANGRGFRAQIAFGDGGPGTYLVNLWRQRDVNQNWHGVLIFQQLGTRASDLVRVTDDAYANLPLYGPADETGWFRLQRTGGVVTVWFSDDGATWNALLTHDFGAALDGLQQRLILTGGSWFVPAGSYADWDYVSLQPLGTPPSISCPADMVVGSDANACGANVTYSVTATGDPSPSIACSTPSGTFFTAGTTTVTCTATNDHGTDSCSFDVTVTDDDAPAINGLTAAPATLWPPNGKMHDVTLSYISADNCGGGQCTVSVSSNESPDFELVDAMHVRLAAARWGTGTGRVYTITTTCTDGAGNVSTATTTVTVPHHQ